MSVRTVVKPRGPCVRFSDPTVPGGVEVTATEFRRQCHHAALARFRTQESPHTNCRTVEHAVPPKHGDLASTGSIVAHVSAEAWQAWQAAAPGTPRQRKAHVEAQVHLVLEDLAEQDMHGCLALTDAQRDLFVPDLAQLLAEALERTTFSRLGRVASTQWEGTLVESVTPPFLVLVISIATTPCGSDDVGRQGERELARPALRLPPRRRARWRPLHPPLHRNG